MSLPHRALGLALLAAACTGPTRHEAPPAAPPPRATATAPPPPVDAGTPAAPAARIGTAHPVTLIAASPSKSWVALCQARRDTNGDGSVAVSLGPHGALLGDRLQPELVLANGRSLPIDDLVAWEPGGRWLVIAREGRRELLDATTGSASAIPAAGPLALDGRAHTLAYVRGASVALLDLATGAETTVTPGAGVVGALELDATGAWLIARVVTSDGDGDGRLRWPELPARATTPCVGPIPRLAGAVSGGDLVSVAVAPRAGGTARPVDGFVAALGNGFVVRDADGRLLLQQGDDRLELAPSKCGARVLHADAVRNLLVVACSAERPRAPLALVGAGLYRALDVDIAFLGHDRAPAAAPRLVALYPGSDTGLLDMDRQRWIRLEPGDAVIATHGGRALVRRERRLLLRDVDTAVETLLPGDIQPLIEPLVAGKVGVVAPLIVDVARGRLLGRMPGELVAVAEDGSVLVASGGAADADRLALGPLEWRAPLPLTDTR